MAKVEITKHINTSPQKVWDFISDVEKAPEWVTVMQSLVETTDNPVKEGTVYRERSKIGSKESETVWRVTRFESPKIQIHECKESDFAATLTMGVEESDSGAKLIHKTDYALMPNFRPLGWLLEKLFVHKTMVKNMNESIDNCKRILEMESKSL
jgi:carbon monoxide dehydrogenase subunit G